MHWGRLELLDSRRLMLAYCCVEAHLNRLAGSGYCAQGRYAGKLLWLDAGRRQPSDDLVHAVPGGLLGD